MRHESFAPLVSSVALRLSMGWQFWIDRGGTFTDIVGESPDGDLYTEKLLSENPEHYPDSAIEGMRRLLGLTSAEQLSERQIDSIKMGTTVATNALLERRGTKTLLAITKGFADALFIGTQHRPRIFELKITRPPGLYSDVMEVPERLYADGRVETPIDIDATSKSLEDAFKNGFRSVAIALLHADRHPQHEKLVASLAKEVGFTQISSSHDVIPLMKLVSRGDTTVADAYLSPELRRYVAQVSEYVGATPLFFMQSSGGLVGSQKFRGRDAVLSGPAGGVVGMAEVAKAAGFDKAIGFDMGGTSTDVSHYAGTYERTTDSTVAGVRLRAPMMDIHTVAAGGGSQCIFDGLRFRVGPESAGAFPGPAAYRRGGPLTITDCNVMLGRIQPEHFPAVFGHDANEPLDIDAVRVNFEKLAAEVSISKYGRLTSEHLAEGFIELAVENMASAIKTISVQRGHDLAAYTLVSFGGAGGQHACRIADALGMSRILIHDLAGVLSAYGMGLASLRVLKQQTIALPLDSPNLPRINEHVSTLCENALHELGAQCAQDTALDVHARIHIRLEGSDTTLAVEAGSLALMQEQFEAQHVRLFGFLQGDKALIAESIEVEAVSNEARSKHKKAQSRDERPASATTETCQMWVHNEWREVPVYERNNLLPNSPITGPAIVAETNSTTVVEPDWRAEVLRDGELLLARHERQPTNPAIDSHADPIKIEVFNSLFMSIAEQMGAVLQNTAHSVNIKERLDFSCAVFDDSGDLIANAPHMPVHLGSMGESVRAVLQRHKSAMSAGDMFVTNAPYNGGTHLPDITVVAPVYDQATQQRAFFVAARGHHADIGGLTPGSMPPHSKTIYDEGILLDAVPMIRAGTFLEQEITGAFVNSDNPARNPTQNIADLRAQAAACTKGAKELQNMISYYGLEGVRAYTGYVKDNAEEAVRRAIESLEDGTFTAPMDDGAEIHVTVSVDRSTRSATVDFSGTSPQRESNYNAPSAVTKAAVLYVFRTLVDEDIPMNEGCLRPLSIILPPDCMLNPAYPAAVVAGNVETSQVVCDALYAALGRLAASQGTMNNLTFGNKDYQYYETVCGGTGAGPNFNGADAIQSHMTNSRLTDPEVLEWRYPVLVESFKLRAGSGGQGEFNGGDGTTRRIRFLEDMSASILAGRRATKPFGLCGGQDGLSGITTVEKADGSQMELAYADSANLSAGDVIVTATPGGGGYGKPDR